MAEIVPLHGLSLKFVEAVSAFKEEHWKVCDDCQVAESGDWRLCPEGLRLWALVLDSLPLAHRTVLSRLVRATSTRRPRKNASHPPSGAGPAAGPATYRNHDEEK